MAVPDLEIGRTRAPGAARRSTGRPDAVCAKAIDLAQQAAVQVAEPGTVGEHVDAIAAGERLVTHLFTCTAKGYRGWTWAVSVARAPRAKSATVCEVELIAGEDAILPPHHVPWEERLRPGDLGAGDVLAHVDDDPRLIFGFEATGEQDVDAVALDELGLGRHRVLSAQGRAEAAQRWLAGDFGPDSEVARAADAPCASCGFLLPVTGALRPLFGLCANEWSPADGRVVSLGYGCGAHSETDVERRQAETIRPLIDDFALTEVTAVEPVVTGGPQSDEGQVAAPDSPATSQTEQLPGAAEAVSQPAPPTA